MRYKVTIAYDGHNYFGWQVQDNAPTIQPVVERVIGIITKSEVTIYASGRTDTDVHAYGQVFHFDSDLPIPNPSWIKALNALLPDDIRVIDVQSVSDDFHARYSAKSKTYIYKINTGAYNLFERDYIYQYGKHLDLDTFNEYANMVIGTHDFGSFNATPFEVVPNQVKHIERFSAHYENDTLIIEIKGSGFLRHMVRVLVGTFIALCETKISVTTINDALEHPNKQKIRYKAPGLGLYLHSVTY